MDIDEDVPPPSSSSSLKREREPILDAKEMREEAERTRRLKRRKGAADVGIEEDSDSEDQQIDAVGESKPMDSLFEDAADMGIEIEKFNMKQEIADGVIVGSVVDTRGRAEKDEAWLSEFDASQKTEAEIEKYQEQLNIAQKVHADRAKAEANAKDADPRELLKIIASVLNDDESVGGAVSRLGPVRKGGRKKLNAKPQKVYSIDEIKERTEKWNMLVEAADTLVGIGFTDIYQLSKFAVENKLEDVNVQMKVWKYRFEGDGEIYGPFSTKKMREWDSSGVFKESKLPLYLINTSVPNCKFVPYAQVNLYE
eukprot:TRINITY_DN334_c1_g1_i1.p1 TRINITY_DN334_c1_g1~~TRINITY_DN334_c1_g1_i1.p1  ORF type:complete len:332 (+),score=122.25 TRINITY_DN334_c1_g1_i1:65-997(+)